ncbi:MAG: ComEC/Rec2 family competence protein [Pirellulaceae bacterium]
MAYHSAATGSSATGPIREGEHPLVGVFFAACLGVVVDRHVAIAASVWCCTLVLALTVWLVVRRRAAITPAAFLVLLSVAAVAGLWHHDRWWLFPADEIARYARDVPAPACVRVAALEPPRTCPAEEASALCTMARGEVTRLPVRLLSMRQAARWEPVSGYAMLLSEGQLTDVLRGDVLEVAGTLTRIRSPANPGEPDMAALRRQSRQLVAMYSGHPACVKVLQRGGTCSLLRPLGRLRLWAEGVFDRWVGAPQSALAAALLLGNRERLDRSLVQVFFITGTIHLLSISGMHVSILASVFWLLTRLAWFPRRWLFAMTCVLVVGYATLTGGEPPVVRATILIVVFCLARGMGRQSVIWNSLAAAGLITIALSPGEVFDVGTQLSFLAVAVLFSRWPTLLSPHAPDPLQQLIEQSRPGWLRVLRAAGGGIWQLALTSTVVWLVTLPLVTNRFHLVPLFGALLTLLLWLPVAVAMFSGMAVLIVEPVPLLAEFLGWICNRSLVLTQGLTARFAAQSWGHLWVAGPPDSLVLAFYVALAVPQFSAIRLPRRWWLALLATWLMLVLACGGTAARGRRSLWPQPLTISFIAVGHGASVLIEMPSGETMLYDAGRMGSPLSAVQPISSVLWSKGIAHLDAVVLSHADVDHFNAVPDLLDRFSIGAVYVSPVMFRRDAAALSVLKAAIERANVPLEEILEGDAWVAEDGVRVEVLHPPAMGCRSGDNSNSIVLRLGYLQHGVLLPGDLEGDGLDELLAEAAPVADVLMAPHHGSRLSRPHEVTAWASPATVILSAGAAADISRFLSAFEQCGADVRWTHRDGLLEIRIDPRGLMVQAWREHDP